MSIFMRVDQRSNLLKIEVEGEHSELEELRDVHVALDFLIDNPGMNLLCDRRKQTRDRDPAFNLSVADLIRKKIQRVGPRKFAYVVSEDQISRVNRKFCPALTEHGLDIRIYSDLSGALSWLAEDRMERLA
ncbi:MAG: hypothetical protein HUJ31_17225 [Pseudomonadales bacterium]|nr:hypothetical protein [Pseudomonadales bacterium]